MRLREPGSPLFFYSDRDIRSFSLCRPSLSSVSLLSDELDELLSPPLQLALPPRPLPHHASPRLAFLLKLRLKLILDERRRADAFEAEGGVELDGGRASLGELEGVGAGGDAAAPDERGRGGEEGAEGAEGLQGQRLDGRTGEPTDLSGVGWMRAGGGGREEQGQRSETHSPARQDSRLTRLQALRPRDGRVRDDDSIDTALLDGVRDLLDLLVPEVRSNLDDNLREDAVDRLQGVPLLDYRPQELSEPAPTLEEP